MKAYTDYPIVELGDMPGEDAPVREVTPLGYDTDKYVKVEIQGHEIIFKAGYLYSSPGRLGTVPNYPVKDLPNNVW